MDEETKKRLDAIEALAKTSAEANVALTRENAELKAKAEKLEREATERAATERKSKIELNRKAITDRLEQAVKGKLILPAQRETFTKLLKVSDDEAMFTANVGDVEELIKTTSGGKAMKFTEQGRGHDHEGDKDRVHDDAGDELHRLAVEFQDSHPKTSYTIALERVMQSHPDLAAEHIGGLAEEAA